MIHEYLPKNLNHIIKEDLEKICSAELPWERLRNKTVIVTGGAGFLASYLVQSLLAIGRKYHLNVKVVCVVRNLDAAQERYASYKNCPELLIYHQDISLPCSSSLPLADFIIHSASQASPKYYGIDPVGTLQANSVGTMHLLEHAIRSKSEKFLFFSSGEVYGIPINPSKIIGETDYGYVDPMNVRSCYAESKRMGETMCVSWAKQFGLDVSIVRPFHTYGPGMALNDGRVFADFVADILSKRNIILKSDGLAQRPFCYIGDATVGFLTVLLKGQTSEAYNVANPRAEISMKNLAFTLTRLFPEFKLNVEFRGQSPGANYLNSSIPRQIPSIEKVSKLGWIPIINIEDGFRRTINSYWSLKSV
jgi:nucleoside-diphosphate-sugar epimerase